MTFELIDGASLAVELTPTTPCCGVLAVANFAGVSFDTAWAAILPTVKRPGRWRGSTYDWQRRAALRELGVRWVEMDRAFLNGRSVANFVERIMQDNVMYKVHMRGHVVTVFNGIVTDQTQSVPVAEHASRRRKVTSVWVRED